jgi:aminoglycoside phosphotransferase (APT) family kinase protein
VIDQAVLKQIVSEWSGGPARDIRVSPMQGGLEARGVAKVTFRLEGATNRQTSVIAKRLARSNVRELHVYRALDSAGDLPIHPKLLGWRRGPAGDVYLILEWIAPAQRWPWRDPRHIRAVVDKLALVHRLDPTRFADAVAGWDYDTELSASAASTIEAYLTLRRGAQGFRLRSMNRTLERLASALPSMRRHLISFGGTALIHGDIHPGNAVIRRSRQSFSAILLDWGRARFGSPLEDLCGWLQSLAFWEPEARKTHDGSIRAYLRATGLAVGHCRQFRDAYWLAGALNAFAGALRYHLLVAGDELRRPCERENSLRAAADWLRILRRADACWRT